MKKHTKIITDKEVNEAWEKVEYARNIRDKHYNSYLRMKDKYKKYLDKYLLTLINYEK